MSEGYARLTGYAFTGHPFRCRVFGCSRLVEWVDLVPGVSVGFCDEHRTRWSTVPIAIYGPEHVAWCEWPMSLVAYFGYCQRGAFDAHGRTRPFAEWSPQP